MTVRTYGLRSNSNSRSNNSNSLNFDDTDGFNDSLSQESPQEDLEASNGDIFNFAFTSQESIKNPYTFDSLDSDPYSFDSCDDSRKLPPRSKKPKTALKGKKSKKPLVMLTETTTLMETQEFGEMMEHADEVDFALEVEKRATGQDSSCQFVVFVDGFGQLTAEKTLENTWDCTRIN